MNFITKTAAAAMIAGTLVPMSAFAAGITTGVDTSGSASVGVGAGVSGSASASGNSNSGASGSMNGNGSTSANAQMGIGASASSTTGTDRALEVLSKIDLTRNDVDNAMAHVSANDAASVATSDDLSAYAKGTLSSDERVKRVSVDEDSVSLSYDEQAHFLGVFPAYLTATAMADGSGKVSVHYPWYRFLFSTASSELEATLQAQVSATMNGSANASGQLSASAAARALAVMHEVMKARLDADMNASASGSANAGTNQ